MNKTLRRIGLGIAGLGVIVSTTLGSAPEASAGYRDITIRVTSNSYTGAIVHGVDTRGRLIDPAVIAQPGRSADGPPLPNRTDNCAIYLPAHSKAQLTHFAPGGGSLEYKTRTNTTSRGKDVVFTNESMCMFGTWVIRLIRI